MDVANWSIPIDKQVCLINVDIDNNPQHLQLNAALSPELAAQVEQLFFEYKDVFAWSYTNLKGIPKDIAMHRIELDTSIPPSHQNRYMMNPNYAKAMKEDLEKLLEAGFIELVDHATWLLPIVVVPKKNGKLQICMDFRPDAATRKDPYPLPVTDEVMDAVIGWYRNMAFFIFVFSPEITIRSILEPKSKMEVREKFRVRNNYLGLKECSIEAGNSP